MTTYFIVRARVADESLRDAFDRWYRDEHLPDARKAFGAKRAFRGWSDTDPLTHVAFYEFDSTEAAHAIHGSPELKTLISEFDRVWGDRVTRARDFVDVVQVIRADGGILG